MILPPFLAHLWMLILVGMWFQFVKPFLQRSLRWQGRRTADEASLLARACTQLQRTEETVCLRKCRVLVNTDSPCSEGSLLKISRCSTNHHCGFLVVIVTPPKWEHDLYSKIAGFAVCNLGYKKSFWILKPQPVLKASSFSGRGYRMQSKR